MIDQFKNNLSKCIEYDTPDLASNSGSNPYGFEEISDVLNRLFHTCRTLLEFEIDKIPEPVLDRSNNQISVIPGFLDSIKNFDPVAQDVPPATTRGKICRQVKEAFDAFLGEIGPWISYVKLEKIDALSKISTLENTLARKQQNFDDYVSTQKDEINKLKSDARNTIASLGLDKFSGSFVQECKILSKRSKWWLVAAVIFFVATLSFGFWLYYDTRSASNNVEQVVITLVRGTPLVVLLLTASLWSGRIYRALVHQVSVNRHRSLSLQTFEAFTSAANDQQIKDAVLMEATRTIFAHSSSGYFGSAQNEGNQNANLIEILRASGSARGMSGDK